MDDQLPVPVDPGDAGDLVWAEFCGQFTNYDHRASKNRQAYQWSTIPLNPAK